MDTATRGSAARDVPRPLARLLAKHSPMSILFLCLAWTVDAFLLIEVPAQADVVRALPLSPAYRWAVLALAALALLMLIAKSDHTFRGLAAIHLAVSMVLLVLYKLPVGSVLLLLAVGVLPAAVYEPFPVNLCLCGVHVAVIVGTCGVAGRYPALLLCQLAAAAALLSLTGSLMGRHWERVVSLEALVTRQEDNVAALARANSLSQDYARDVEEESRVAERLSLTRDIHDAIGYTLTSTIMALEAVKMMVNAERLSLSEQTVRNYMHSLYDAFEVKDRMELIQRLKDAWPMVKPD